jgi:hypothetical protein
MHVEEADVSAARECFIVHLPALALLAGDVARVSAPALDPPPD